MIVDKHNYHIVSDVLRTIEEYPVMSRFARSASSLAVSLVLLTFLTVPPRAEELDTQYWPVLTRPQVQSLIETISGETIVDSIRYLAQYWRWAPSHAFHTVAEHMAATTTAYGLKDAHIERFIADKKTRYSGQTMNRPSWDPIAAELWVVDPVRQKITSFADIPMCVAGYSRNTDVTAELVDVGAGTSPDDYAGKNVQGKVVLATGPVGTLQQMAIFERGALGVLSAWSPDLQTSRDPIEFPDFVTWGTGVVPESATGMPSTFGIMLSRRQRETLLNLMKNRTTVKVHVTVKADLEEPGYLEVATAVIPGTEFPEQEILFTAHLDHPRPAANDNDSGSATILEVARVLERLIQSGQLPPPKRTIRFLWVEEGRSTRAYVASHPELARHVIADINMDIVGSDSEKTRAILYYWGASASHPSFVSDVIEDYFELVRNVNNDRMPTERLSPILSQTGSRRPFIASIQRYMRPSDQSFLISEGIPGVNFAAWPDQFHHTQFDTPEKSDPTLLTRVAFIAAASAAAVANAGSQDFTPLLTDVVGRAHVRLGEDLFKSLRLLDRADEDQIQPAYREAVNVIGEGYRRELRNLQSMSILAGKDKTSLDYLNLQQSGLAISETADLKQVELYFHARAGEKTEVSKPSAEEVRARHEVPVWLDRTDPEGLFQRLGKEQINTLKILHYTSQTQAPFVPDFNVILFETLNFVDGKRDIASIRDAVSAEYSVVPLEVIEGLFAAMQRAKLIKIESTTE
jgi:hypothetical protein